MKLFSTFFLLLSSLLVGGQVDITVRERTKIYLIDAYVKKIGDQKESMDRGIAEGEFYNEKKEIVGGHETYTYVDKKTEKLKCIEHNESKETYRTEAYYFKNDTLVYAFLTNPKKDLLVNDSGKYYFIDGKCYFFTSLGTYRQITRQDISKSGQNHLAWHLKEREND